ncbi:hypothetical protein HDU86_007813 [Geranomyces michiganensis]|nr:hypothetical protein HDU86_007813 [Geranomyces michiganensis]
MRGIYRSSSRLVLSQLAHSLPRINSFSPLRAGRSYASSAPSSLQPVHQVFNRTVKRRQRDRAALREDSRDVDYLKDEVADRLVDRLLDIKRRFGKVVDLGSGAGHIAKFVDKEMMDSLIMYDSSEKLLHRDAGHSYAVPVTRIHGDEESLPFAPDSVDAILSSLSLHWVNDIPGTLIQACRALKPDGVFVGAMFGGETLYELRTAMQLAQIEREGGVSPHVSPMTEVKDVAALLQRAGFNLITVDVDEIAVSFPSMFELIADLRAMGESNAVAARKPHMSRDLLLAAAAAYKDVYGAEDGSVPATFQVIYMIGWKPDPSQPKPLPRGSGEVSFKDLESGLKAAPTPPPPPPPKASQE